MVLNKTLKNTEIYEAAAVLLQDFSGEDMKLPIKASFYLQKNITAIVNIGKELDEARQKILAKYGTLDEEKQAYNFNDDVIPTVNAEITELFSCEQEVAIYPLKLEWFDNVELNQKQISAISFMFEEE